MAQRKKTTNSKSTKSAGTTAKASTDKTNGKATAVKATGAQSAKSATPEVVMVLNHEQIAKRAFAIWIAKGRPHGQDAQNWQEAKQVLTSELARRA